MKKIGFLYLEKTYMVYHSLGIAIELSKKISYEVYILCSQINFKYIKKSLHKKGTQNINIIVLRPFWFFPLPYYFELKLQFRKRILKKYASYIQTYDAIVCTVYDDIIVKNFFMSSRKVIFIFTNHGIPNRKYSFDDRLRLFDFFFILGEKERRIRAKQGQLTSSNYKTSGFLKYDMIKHQSFTPLFENTNLTIVYNPHWTNNFSSFNKFGFKILNFFAKNQNYNLIFAPHSLLIEWNWLLKIILSKYKYFNNIIVDFGSERSNDMTYTREADIYIGDISSQAFEFLFIKPRPCIFLDAHQLNNSSKDRPLSWDLGDVIFDVDSFEEKLDLAITNHNIKYKQIQVEVLKDIFFTSNHPPSYLAAEAIHNLLQKKIL